jgi:xanthine dehydrogenase molybdopterin-binding subunit B
MPTALQPNQTGNTSSTAASTSDSSNSASSKDAAAQALSRMVAALSQRYDTEGGKPVGKYLNTAA